jgi:hypothetical protein
MTLQASVTSVGGRRSGARSSRTVSTLLRSGLRAALLGLAVMPAIGAARADAAVGAPAWHLISEARPSVFAPGPLTECQRLGESVCDSYTILATNVGNQPTDGSTITIADALPAGVVAKEVSGLDWAQNAQSELECTVVPLQCVDEHVVAPDHIVELRIHVEVTSASGAVANQASITGGGATATVTDQNTVGGAPSGFDLARSEFETKGIDGAPDLQAGGHPFEQLTSVKLASVVRQGNAEPYGPAEEPKNIVAYLPAGFIGNPLATPRCPLALLEQTREDFEFGTPAFGEFLTRCPPTSIVGAVRLSTFTVQTSGTFKAFGKTTALFNLTPEQGHPAEFGFRFIDKAIILYADVVRRHREYVLRVSSPGIPAVGLTNVEVSLYGEPGPHDGEPAAEQAFLTNPTRCTENPLMIGVESNSWADPARWVNREDTAYPKVTGCESLQFEPQITVQPENTQADSPSGYAVDMHFPGANPAGGVLQEPELKTASVTLPAGTSISPSAADGLEGCDATGPNGIDIPNGMPHPDEAGEGETLGPDGLAHLTPGHCPAKSQIADVEIATSLLPAPLKGHLFLATPRCGGEAQPACTEASATNGELYRGYLEAEGSGVVVKLEGRVSADPATGRLTATFDNNPQLPFDDLKVRINGGPRAPLANPQSCGTATATSDLTPWSTPVTPDATPFSSFQVTGCGASMPFAPSFNAGTITPTAGDFSPFTLTFARHDGEQDLSGLTSVLSPGLLAKLAGVPLCSAADAGAGVCPEASRIGTVNVAVGAGSHPLWVTGRIYLTGPYRGGPFGEAVEVPAVAGPFNLGTVVVRGAIYVDPHTAQASVVSDPFPQILDGVPLRTKTVNVVLDRPGFSFNPTNCDEHAVTGTLSSAQGATAGVSSPFAVTGCSKLPFKPTFAASTTAKANKRNGASLNVQVVSPAGQANIKAVKVDLPLQLPSRLTTLQKACLAAVFAVNPAACPPESIVGAATAHTPVLPVPVTGPAYIVSHGGEAFPNLVIVLQGDGVTVQLTGQTQIKHGITTSSFPTVPDVPVTSFELRLPQGPHSILAAYGNLCTHKLNMPTKITGQNGATINQTTVIHTTNCPKTKKHAKHKTRRHPSKRHG